MITEYEFKSKDSGSLICTFKTSYIPYLEGNGVINLQTLDGTYYTCKVKRKMMTISKSEGSEDVCVITVIVKILDTFVFDPLDPPVR